MTETVQLPGPVLKSKVSVEEAISARRSRRSFTAEPLTLDQVAQILWAAQGITEPKDGFRVAPSAGATFPIELYLAAGENAVSGLSQGVYRYVPSGHELASMGRHDIRRALADAALGQHYLAEAPLDVLIAVEYERTARRYGSRGERYVHMEVGHVGQNVYLQAEALGLGTVAVGAFDDREVAAVFRLPPEHVPLCLMPVGNVAGHEMT